MRSSSLMQQLIGSRPDEIYFTRTPTLSVLQLFQLDRRDSASILSSLYYADINHDDNINMKVFAKLFCLDKCDVFNNLYYKYNTLYKNFSKDKSQTNNGDTLLIPTIDFIGFLFFLLSFEDKELPKLIYWTWYHSPKVDPSVENLCDLIDELWGQTRRNAKKRSKYKSQIKTMLKSYNMNELDAGKFQLFDWRSKGAWSLPVQQMCRVLKTKLIGNIFWNRISPHLKEFFRKSYKDEIKPLIKKMKIHKKSRKIKILSFFDNNNSEIKNTRKILKNYVKFIKTYEEMGNEEEQSSRVKPAVKTAQPAATAGNFFENINFGDTFLLKFVNLNFRRFRKIFPGNSVSEELDDSRIRNFNNKGMMNGHGHNINRNPEEDDDMSLEERYKHASMLSMDDLAESSRQAIIHARSLLELTRSELIYTIDWHEDGGNNVGASIDIEVLRHKDKEKDDEFEVVSMDGNIFEVEEETEEGLN